MGVASGIHRRLRVPGGVYGVEEPALSLGTLKGLSMALAVARQRSSYG